jgi:hypothetical protein
MNAKPIYIWALVAALGITVAVQYALINTLTRTISFLTVPITYY